MEQSTSVGTSIDIYETLKKGSTYKDQLGVIEYECSYTKRAKNQPSMLRVSVSGTSNSEFEIVRETWSLKLFKALGITNEIQTGDREFDRKYYIISDDPLFASAYFMDVAKINAASEIFGLGFTEIKFGGGQFECGWKNYKLKKEADFSFVESAVPHLSGLTKGIPDQPSFGDYAPSHKSSNSVHPIVMISIVLFLVGGAALMIGIIKYQPLDNALYMAIYTLKYSMSAYFVYVFLSTMIIRGRSSSYKDFITIVIASLIAFPIAGWGFTAFANGYFDESPSAYHSVLVMKKNITHSKDGRHYKVYFKSWRIGKDREKIEVKREIYERVAVGESVMEIETKPGRLGFEWVFHYRLE